MIDCSSENIWYKKKRKVTRVKRVISFIIIIVFLMSYYNFIVVKNLKSYCENYIQTVSTNTINQSIYKYMSGVKYNQLVSVEKNSNGEIIMLSANSININALNKNIVMQVTDSLNKEIAKGLNVPILAFSGIRFISGFGRPIKLKTLSLAKVNSEFNNTFQSVGINQTLHSIYINIKCDVKLGLSLSNQSIHAGSSFLVAETVLVGKIPEMYLSGKLFG